MPFAVKCRSCGRMFPAHESVGEFANCSFCSEPCQVTDAMPVQAGTLVRNRVRAAASVRTSKTWSGLLASKWVKVAAKVLAAAVVIGLAAVIVYFAKDAMASSTPEQGEFLTVAIKTIGAALAGLLLYFLPTVIAAYRLHPNAAPVFVVNLFLGWTLVGFVVALAWSVSHIGNRQRAA